MQEVLAQKTGRNGVSSTVFEDEGERHATASPAGGREAIQHRSARVAEMMVRYLGDAIVAGFADDDVTEIYVNPQDGRIRFDTRRRGKVDTGERIGAQRIEQFLNAVADLHGVTLDGENPAIQAELPVERFRGARLQGFRPPMSAGASFVVRKPPAVVYTLDEYVARGILPSGGREILREAVREHWNVLVAGGTGSGKTTFTNALLKEITDLCPDERIVILEDTVELQCEAKDHLALRTTPSISLAQLVRHTLRAYPDRIVVGEVRGPEALDLLDAWSTGHPGGLGTFHAQDAPSALLRLDRLCQRANVPSQLELIADAVDLLAIMEGGHRSRRITDLVRVRGLGKGGAFDLQSLLPDAGKAPS